jgi:hypothetical protein
MGVSRVHSCSAQGITLSLRRECEYARQVSNYAPLLLFNDFEHTVALLLLSVLASAAVTFAFYVPFKLWKANG